MVRGLAVAPALLLLAACIRLGFDGEPVPSFGEDGPSAVDSTGSGDSSFGVEGVIDLGQADLKLTQDLPHPDLPPCDESPCRLVLPQCGCPKGKACLRLATNQLICGEAGNVAPYQPCVGAEDCVAGHTCWVVSPSPQGVCTPYCKTTAECGNTLPVCLLGPTYGVCLPGCDPVGQNCAGGMACILTNGTDAFGVSHAGTSCAQAGSGQPGDSCTSVTHCAAGMQCIGQKCHAICQVGGAKCAANKTCAKLTPAMKIAGKEYGACI
jgi:hypothetical protein